MVSPLDSTLEALQNVQDAINEIKVRKNITVEKEKLQDYDKIIKHLEDSISNMLNAVVVFQKYEKALQMTLLFQNSCSSYICKKWFRLSVLQQVQVRSLGNPV
jgi:hypothetical protein